MRDDRDVEIKGDHLYGRTIEFVVTGGIACIESPRMIRELRRYGARVRVWMTKAATEFVSPRVFEWASKEPVITDLTGAAEHITHADAVIVAPATLDFIAKTSMGFADSAALTMVQSALSRVPIFFMPSMHESLAENPIHQQHLENLKRISKLNILSSKREESKLKMLSPESLAAFVCHEISQSHLKGARVAMTLGPTRSYADDIRYLSNRSSGALGIAIADELFRRGADVHSICGPLSVSPPDYLKFTFVETGEQMAAEFEKIIKSKNSPQIGIFCAAVLDFEIETKLSGKVSSEKNWELKLKPSSKLIERFRDAPITKVAFKLESHVSEDELRSRAKTSALKYNADFCIANLFEDVSMHEHRAWIWCRRTNEWIVADSKLKIARELVRYLDQNRDSALKPIPLPAAPETFLK